jgi:hypothetical protein
MAAQFLVFFKRPNDPSARRFHSLYLFNVDVLGLITIAVLPTVNQVTILSGHGMQGLLANSGPFLLADIVDLVGDIFVSK